MNQKIQELVHHWRLLLACFLGISAGVSSLYFYSIGIFMKPLAAEFDWTRSEASLGALVGTLCAAIMVIPTGILVDRYGSKIVAFFSLLILALSFFLLGALTEGLTSYLVIIAFLSLLTAGSTPLAFTRLVIVAFEKSRGLALGICIAGTGTGGILLPKYLVPLIGEFGWRMGYFSLGGVILIAIPILWMLLLNAKDPCSAEQIKSSKLSEHAKTPLFIKLVIIFTLASIAILGTVAHFFSMLTDSGLSPAQAGAIASIIGIAVILGRLITGILLDILHVSVITAALFLMAALGFFVLAIGGIGYATLGALIIGLAIGSEVDLIAYWIGKFFPNSIYGGLYGLIYAFFLLGGAFGPYIAGLMFDHFASYINWLFFAGSILCISALLSFLIGLSKTTYPHVYVSK